LPNLTVHDGDLKPMVEILPVQIKGQYLSQKKQNVLLPPPINRGGFHAPSMEKFEAKV